MYMVRMAARKTFFGTSAVGGQVKGIIFSRGETFGGLVRPLFSGVG